MKKEYTKPNMEIVSFNLAESITTGSLSSPITTTTDLQKSFTTITY